MKKTVLIFIALCLLIGCAQSTNQWCGLQDAYFNNTALGDLTGYETLMNFPSGSPEITESITVINTGGTKLIDTYIMPAGSLANTLSLDSGLRRYRIYAYVSSATGTTQLNFTAFRRFVNGTEQDFYTALSGDINDLTVTEYDFNYVLQNTLMLNPTDRLGVRVSANTTHSSPITVYWVYQGSLHTSMFETGYFECPTPSTTNTNESYAYSPSGATPLSEWIVVALTAIALFVCAFYFKLRNEYGEISKERIVFSIVSTVVGGIAAYLSLEIIIPSGGMATSVVYQETVIAILFVMTSIISFANFIYSIIQPEIIKPKKKDYNGQEEERK